MKLTTNVGALVLNTPLILASGHITETPDFYLRARPMGCAGMVTRSLREIVPVDRQLMPAPRYAVIDGESMLNCEWSNEQPWQKWRDNWVQQIRESSSGAIIISLSGRDISGCLRLIATFDVLDVSAFELNVSCSHSGSLHGDLNTDLVHLERLVGSARRITKRPLWVKLSYSTILLRAARLAAENGADAIVCTNTIGPGMLVDIESCLPLLGSPGGVGGLSGRAIFPIALYCVYAISRNIRIPVVGSGGISSAADVIQMIMAGASAVQLYTAPALRGPSVFSLIRAGLSEFLEQHSQYSCLRDMVGQAHAWPDTPSFKAKPPRVDANRCVSCGACVLACTFGAIELAPAPVLNGKCVGCNACVGMCRTGALQHVLKE